MRVCLSVALITTGLLLAGPSYAQYNGARIVDMRSEQAREVRVPVQYNQDGFVRTQYVRAEDLSPEELDALLVEAEKIKRYRASNPRATQHITPVAPKPRQATRYSATPDYGHSHAHMSPADRARHIDYYHNPNVPVYTPPPSASPVVHNAQYNSTYTGAANRSHTVTKGETLYSISRRYNISVPVLQRMNGIRGTTISIGQVLTVPGGYSSSPRRAPTGSPVVSYAGTHTSPQTVSGVRRVTRPVDEMPVLMSSSASADAVWAVLPQDTLYRIAERSCMPVDRLVEVNGINRSAPLMPGQRLTIPAGHCLNNR